MHGLFALQILNEEITPTLTKLKNERSSYLEYQKIQREFQNLNKLFIAHQFVRAQGLSKRCDADLKKKLEENTKLRKEMSDFEKQVGTMEEKINQMEKKRDEVSIV